MTFNLITFKSTLAALFVVWLPLAISPASAELIYDGSDLPTVAFGTNPAWRANLDGPDPLSSHYSLLPAGCTPQVDCDRLAQHVTTTGGQHFNSLVWSTARHDEELNSTTGWSYEVRAGNVTASNVGSGLGLGNGFIFVATDETDKGAQFAWRLTPGDNTKVDIHFTDTPGKNVVTDTGGNPVQVLGLAANEFHTIRVERAPAASDLTVMFHGPGVPGGTQTFSVAAQQYPFNAAIFGAGGGGGTGEWDFVHFNAPTTIGPPPAPATDFDWSVSGTGIWTDNTSWTSSPDGYPNDSDHTATFGELVSGPTSAVTHDAVTVNRIEFNNATNSYAISGLGSVTLAANSVGQSPSIAVQAGTHEFQVPLNLSDNLDVISATDTTLSMNHALNLNGNSLIKLGSGNLNVNNVLNSGNGSFTCLEGICGGTGTVGADFANNAVVAPGSLSSSASAVPEPSSLILLGLSIIVSLPRIRRVS